MSRTKVPGKPHLALFRGFWSVRWPAIVDSEDDPVKEVALWLITMNDPIVKPLLLCDNISDENHE